MITSLEDELLIITESPEERSIAVTFFSLCSIMIIILVTWMAKFYLGFSKLSNVQSPTSSCRRRQFGMRRPWIMLASYLIVIPWVAAELISFLVLYFDDIDRNTRHGRDEWVSCDGVVPIVYDEITDLRLHFLFWFSFCAFIQMKIFRLWMIRFDFEYNKTMKNIEWKSSLGLSSVRPTSTIVRYRSVFGSTRIMLALHILVAAFHVFLQMLVRLLPSLECTYIAQYYEHVVISTLFIIELCVVIFIIYKEPMKAVNDVHLVRSEWIMFVKCCIVLTCAYLVCLAVWVRVEVAFVWVRGLALLLVTLTTTMFGYIDFVWIADKLRASAVNGKQGVKWVKWLQDDVKLADIFEFQDGFEALMRYLMAEHSCHNMLCYVECSHFAAKWTETLLGDMPRRKDRKHLPLIWGYTRLESELAANEFEDATVPDDVVLLVLSYYKKLYLDERREMTLDFPYFQHLQFEEIAPHYRYLVGKYVRSTAAFPIKMNSELRGKMVDVMGELRSTDSQVLVALLNFVRDELWDQISEAFQRFRLTPNYWVLAKEIGPAQLPDVQYKDVHYSIHLPLIESPVAFESDGNVESTSISMFPF